MSEFMIEPTITVYRDSAHVRDLIQLGFAPGYMTESTHVSTAGRNERVNKTTTVGGKVDARISFPPLNGGINAGYDRGGEQGNESSSATTTEIKYLHTEGPAVQHIVKNLKEAEHLKTVEKIKDAKDVNVGDFVEFEASFRPNEISTLLDIFTPESVSGIVAAINQKSFIDGLAGGEWPSYDERERLVEVQKLRNPLYADIAKLVVSGIQADMRSDATREYHALISGTNSPLTAVLACESSAFITGDPDRLLDGNFKVFGKVISRARRDVGILDRSKLLSRIQPEALRKFSEILEGLADVPTGGDEILGNYFNAQIPAKIEGWSFAVMPIAIYI